MLLHPMMRQLAMIQVHGTCVTCKAARKVRVLVENQKRNKIALEKSRHLGIQRHFTRRETAQKALCCVRSCDCTDDAILYCCCS
jgi:hypothetical protein